MRIDTLANAGIEINRIGVNKQCITQRDEKSIASLSEKVFILLFKFKLYYNIS